MRKRPCLTVLARPSAKVQKSVAAFLDQLRQVDPEQYYYDVSELHVTVLSLFTATIEHKKFFAKYDQYFEAVNAALARVPAFGIEFTGVTLTQDAIMIQGYPDNTVLNDIREILRNELRIRNLTEGLDGRYVLQTAHMTAVRFRKPLPESQPFAKILEKYRDYSFGQSQVQEFNLVRNDWYMSCHSVEVLRHYSLKNS